MLLRLPYLALSSMFALVRLLPMSGTDKDIEILALRHQFAVLQRQIDRSTDRQIDRPRITRLSRNRPPGRPATRRAVQALVLRLARENAAWGYWRIHGEPAALGIEVAPFTVWEILNKHGIAPAPDRHPTTWAGFLRSQAEAIVACDFLTATTLTGATYATSSP